MMKKRTGAETAVRQRPAKPSGPPSKMRGDGKGERLTVYLPSETVTDLRVRCARERRSVSDGVTEAVGDWLKRAGGAS